MWLVTLALIVIPVVVFELLYGRQFKKFKNKMPGPPPLPIIGNGLMALGDSAKFVRTLSDTIAKYGDRVRTYLLFELYLFFINPKDVEAILSSSEIITKASSYKFLHPWLGQGLLTSTGQRWRKHRKLLTPAFHFNILLKFMPIFDKNEKILIRKMKELADGKPVDVFPIIALAALDNISECAMGVPISAQQDSESEYVKAVQVMSEITWKRIRNPFYRADLVFNLLPAKARQEHALKILHGFTLDVIKNRRKALYGAATTLEDFQSDTGVKKKVAFLDLLLLSKLDGDNLSDKAIREEVDTFMFEGHDTTTSAISFALYCISQNQRVQNTLYEEQQRIFGDDKNRAFTNSDLASMSYLELVIKEALRLYPSVPIIARNMTQDTRFLGYDIPKGTTVSISMLHMQRDPSVFEEPLSFKPERFLPENVSKRNPYSWVAFSAGPRNCIGQKFAMMEMKTVLSSILRNFTLQPGGIEPVLVADLILRSKNGVHVRFLPR